MITVPSDVANVIENTGRTFTASLTFGLNKYTGVQSLVQSASLAPNTTLALGEAVSATVDIESTDTLKGIENEEFFAEISVAGQSFPLGYYIAGKPVKSGNIARFSAYDRMALADRATYTSQLGYSSETPVTTNQIFAEIVSQIDRRFTAENYSLNLTVDADVLSGYSCRDALKYLAAYLGCNCIVGSDGVFRMVSYASVDAETFSVTDRTMDTPDVASETSSVASLVCTVSEERALTSGTSSISLSFVCPLMTQSRLDAIRSSLSASDSPLKDYTAATVNQLCGDPRIELGDVITVTHRGTSYRVPVMALTRDFDGGLSVAFQSFDVVDMSGLTLAQKIDIAYKAARNPSRYAEAAAEFSGLIGNAMGLYQTIEESASGAKKYYFHNATTIADSTYIFTMTSNGFAWTDDWNNGNPTWSYGISKDGNGILKMLTAYKVSADIINTGELVIKDQDGNIIHKFSYDDLSAQMGGENGIKYNASSGKTVIGSDVEILGSVTIGGGATIGETITNEVNDAVAELDIKGIDHQTVEYQSGASATTVPAGTWVSSPPSVSAGRYLWTRTTTYYSDDPNNENNTAAIAYSVARQGSNGTSVSISSIQYGTSDSAATTPSNYSTTVPTSITKGTWLWTKTTYSNNSTAITKTYIGTDGEDGTSVVVKSTSKSDGVTTIVLNDGTSDKTITIADGQDGSEGKAGAKGEDGKTSYVHFAWANSEDGTTDFSTSKSENKKYIGTYSDFTKADSTTPGDYSWTLIKGEDGEPGKDGSQVVDKSVMYAIGSSGTQAPSGSSSVTEKWYWVNNISDTSTLNTDFASLGSSSVWSNAYSGGYRATIYPCISGTYWRSANPYLYSFDRTDTNGSYSLSNLKQIGTLDGGSTAAIGTETLYCATSAGETDIAEYLRIRDLYSGNFNSRASGDPVISNRITDVYWDSKRKYLYSFVRTVKASNSGYTADTITSLKKVAEYGAGSSSTAVASETWYYSDTTRRSSSYASTINTNWHTDYAYHDQYFFNTGWNSTRPYLYTLTRTIYADGSASVTNLNEVAVYGTSYPDLSDDVWQTTPPDTANYKGQYLWTRSVVSYSNGEEVVTYSVAYIAEAGRGISSQTQYFKAGTSGTTAPASGWTTTASSAGFSAENRYLWTYVVTTYTDGTSNTGTAYVLGVWGQDGDSGSGASGRGISDISHEYCLKSSFNQALAFENAMSDTAFTDVVKIEFVPPFTSTYTFQSTETNDTYGYIYSSSGETLYSDDDSGGSRQFKIAASLTAGTTYYLGARWYSSSYKGNTINATIVSSTTQTDWSTEPPAYAAGMDYYERDVITWTSAPLTTYVPDENGVKSAGISEAIRAVNELNADYAHLIIKESGRTFIDGAKIYTGSVTASDIAAYNALIKNLMANTVDVTGDITITSPALDTSDISSPTNDYVAQELYKKNYSDLETGQRAIVLAEVLSRKLEQAALQQSKLLVKASEPNDFSGSNTAVLPNGVYASNSDGTKASTYGYDAHVRGDLVVDGNITHTYKSEKGYIDVTLSNTIGDYAYGTGSRYFFGDKKQFDSVPLVFLTVCADPHDDYTISAYPCSVRLNNVSVRVFDVNVYWYGISNKNKTVRVYYWATAQ